MTRNVNTFTDASVQKINRDHERLKYELRKVQRLIPRQFPPGQGGFIVRPGRIKGTAGMTPCSGDTPGTGDVQAYKHDGTTDPREKDGDVITGVQNWYSALIPGESVAAADDGTRCHIVNYGGDKWDLLTADCETDPISQVSVSDGYTIGDGDDIVDVS